MAKDSINYKHVVVDQQGGYNNAIPILVLAFSKATSGEARSMQGITTGGQRWAFKGNSHPFTGWSNFVL